MRVVESGALPLVITLLRSAKIIIQEQAVGVIRNLSVNSLIFHFFSDSKAEIRIRLVNEGALPPLIAMLRSPNEGIQENAVVTVRNISVNGPLLPVSIHFQR